MSIPLSTIVSTVAALVMSLGPNRPDRRVVDVAEAGNPESEATHGYAGHDALSGTANGWAFRQARGWMRYALTTFDDTEVTVAFTFIAGDSIPRGYDVVVEDSLIASRTFVPGSTPVVVEFTAPFVVTKGKTTVAVTIRARGGLTPALHEIRTIQDHNEVDRHGHDRMSAIESPSPRLPQLPGVVR